MNSEYLLFNIVVVMGPLIALLIAPKIQKPSPMPTFISILVIALGFIAWDIVVTGDYWYFNSIYILGPTIGGVPWEEILFFVTVPFGCLVLWVNWKAIVKSSNKRSKLIYMTAPLGLIIAAISIYTGWYYTASVAVLYLLCLVLDSFLRTHLFYQHTFQIFLLVVISLTFIFNYYLTARPVVIYNITMKSNINVLTIPIEDFLYGVGLISSVIVVYEYSIQRRSLR